MSSPHAQIAFPQYMAYNMAKAALDMMAKTAATELLPLGRLATAEEIAAVVRFLCGPEAAFMTGSVLHLDGGLFLPWWSKRGSEGL